MDIAHTLLARTRKHADVRSAAEQHQSTIRKPAMSTNYTNPKRIVADGYDRIAETYNEWVSGVRTEERARYTTALFERVPSGSEVLELGCGIGLTTTRHLAERYSVTAVDLSPRQVELARENVPSARFLHGDMTQLSFPPESFDAVVAFYSIIHVPREEHPGLLHNIALWLRPGGLLIATLGAQATEYGFEENWLGASMYWSSYDSDTNRRLVEDAGLEIVSAELETEDEFGEPVTFFWVVARKGKS